MRRFSLSPLSFSLAHITHAHTYSLTLVFEITAAADDEALHVTDTTCITPQSGIRLRLRSPAFRVPAGLGLLYRGCGLVALGDAPLVPQPCILPHHICAAGKATTAGEDALLLADTRKEKVRERARRRSRAGCPQCGDVASPMRRRSRAAWRGGDMKGDIALEGTVVRATSRVRANATSRVRANATSKETQKRLLQQRSN